MDNGGEVVATHALQALDVGPEWRPAASVFAKPSPPRIQVEIVIDFLHGGFVRQAVEEVQGTERILTESRVVIYGGMCVAIFGFLFVVSALIRFTYPPLGFIANVFSAGC